LIEKGIALIKLREPRQCRPSLYPENPPNKFRLSLSHLLFFIMKQVISDRGIEITIDITENVSDNTEKRLYNIIRKALHKSIKVANRYKTQEDSQRDDEEDSQRDDEEDSQRADEEDSQRDDEENSQRDDEENSQRADEENSQRDDEENSQRDDEEDSHVSSVDTEEEEIMDTDEEGDILGDILGNFDSMRDEKINKKKIIESSIRDKDISILKQTIKELAKKNTDVPLIIKGLTKEERHWAHVNLSSIHMAGINIRTWSMNVNHERVFYFKIDINKV
jgi:hypothetical protein